MFSDVSKVDLSDKILLRQAIVGDECAFEVLFRRHSLTLSAWARKTLCSGNQEDADELISRAFLMTHKNLQYIDEPDMSFQEIIQRTAIDLQLDRHHEISLRLYAFLQSMKVDSIKAAAWSNLDPQEIRRRMIELDKIKSDPHHQRGLSRLFKLANGMSVSGIAFSEGVKERTVRKTIKAAAVALRNFLQPE